MKLDKYNKKRDFNKTKEPKGVIKKNNKKKRFCVQHHLARRDHFDLRLEYNGILLSWAVPNYPSYNNKDKRLAIQVEDHPLAYRNFEGTIPQGEYGGGIVMLWDIGYYELIEKKNNMIKFILYGNRLKGSWVLVHTKDNHWLLIKENDYYLNFIDNTIYNRSIKTNRTMEQIKSNIKLIKNKQDNNNCIVNYINITNPVKIIFKKNKITKLDIVNYYNKVAPRMLPFIENRIISVIRLPDGENKFFKKHLENKDNYLGKINIPGNSKENDYYYIKDSIGLISEVQMNSFEFHIWSSLASNINKPNMLVFDFDPDVGLDLELVREGVKNLKSILDEYNLKAYLKTSGNKGYHVVVPIKKTSWHKVEEVAKNIADIMVNKWPDKYTTNMRKDKRKNKIFIDYYRNKFSATFVAPYSIRLKENVSVSMPIFWHELDKIAPDEITIKSALERIKKKDPWWDFFL